MVIQLRVRDLNKKLAEEVVPHVAKIMRRSYRHRNNNLFLITLACAGEKHSSYP